MNQQKPEFSTLDSSQHLRHCRKGGFTIVELVIAMLLLAMGLVGMWGLMNATIRNNEYNTLVTMATSLAEDKFEELLEQGYASISNGSDTVDRFSRAWTVTTSTKPDTKTVDINVSWQQSAGGATRQVHLIMIAAE